MKITKTKGFSLAEVLISLTIVSVVLAVAVPTITKKHSMGDDSWHWTTGQYQNGAAYDGQKVLVGNNVLPTSLIGGYYTRHEEGPISSNINSDNVVSKLNVIKNRKETRLWGNSYSQNFADSHISFYNVGGEDNQSQYAGKLALDPFNLAFGIGTLQSLKSNVLNLDTLSYTSDETLEEQNFGRYGSHNTAIGHYALANLIGSNDDVAETVTARQGGYHNVALGYNAMYDNTFGTKNTAIGYNALAKTRSLADSRGHNVAEYSENTVVGNFLGELDSDYILRNSSTDIISGSRNVIIGNYSKIEDAIPFVPTGTRTSNASYTTVVSNSDASTKTQGTYDNEKNSVARLSASVRDFASNNTFIGHNAGRGLPLQVGAGFNNSAESSATNKIMYPKFENTLAIGNVDLSDTSAPDQRVELIQVKYDPDDGHAQKVVINGDLIIRSYDGTRTLFKVDATGIPIGWSEDLHAFTTDLWETVSSPERCENAEICIAKFPWPEYDANFISPSVNNYSVKYDMLIKGMAAPYDHAIYAGWFSGSNQVPRTPLLGFTFWSLDHSKDTEGIVNRANADTSHEGLSGIVCKMFTGNNDCTGGRFFSEFFLTIGDFFGFSSQDSDMRLKNIYGDATIGLKEIDALKVKNYTYKADKNKTPHVGVIAQELKEIFPNSVIEGSDGYLSIKQEEMFYGLVKSIQELSAKNNQIKDKLALTYEQIKYTNEQNKLIEQENKLLEKQNKEFAKRIAKLQKAK